MAAIECKACKTAVVVPNEHTEDLCAAYSQIGRYREALGDIASAPDSIAWVCEPSGEHTGESAVRLLKGIAQRALDGLPAIRRSVVATPQFAKSYERITGQPCPVPQRNEWVAYDGSMREVASDDSRENARQRAIALGVDYPTLVRRYSPCILCGGTGYINDRSGSWPCGTCRPDEA